MKKEYHVYILKCSDKSYYTGITSNLDKRIQEHKEGGDRKCYTYSRRPFTLVFQEVLYDPVQAIEREKQIKGWRRKKKEALIVGDYDKIVELSKGRECRPSTSSG
ncbi:GIY-YIG nuclease family protein [Candidatus Peregrinibacteria bacterium]|jgi:putative endonuclease|nr:GIY-YIG nuclease family protein [Candidatus Peregrinibacteria bacterium]